MLKKKMTKINKILLLSSLRDQGLKNILSVCKQSKDSSGGGPLVGGEN